MAPIIPTGHENILATGKMLELVAFEVDIAGKKKIFETARRAPGVRILFEKNSKILLSREYRRETKNYDYRLPGGKVFDTLVEFKSYAGDIQVAAEEGARREAQEECGIIPVHLELFNISKCGASVEWDLYYYICREFRETGETNLDEDGESDITTNWYTRSEIETKIRSGEISEDRSVGILFKYFLRAGGVSSL